MPKPKINLIKLNQLLKAGKKQYEIAQYFGVTEGAISKAKKQLKTCIIKNIALEHANEAVEKNFSVIDQFLKINAYASELLDLLMAWQRGDETALQVMESQVRERKVKIGDDEETVREFRFKDPRELAIRVMGEIRGQLGLALKIFTSMYDMRAVQEFQEVVLEAIGEVAPDVRAKIIERLNQRRALRGDIKFS